MGVRVKKKWGFLAIIAAVGFIMDVGTKYAAERFLTIACPVSIIGEYVELMLVYNRGAVFGLNPQAIIPGLPLTPFFIIVSGIALGLLFFYYRSLKSSDSMLRWGIALIIPGALGNLSDRILHPQSGVVDFIKIGISREVYWPIFNFADIYVTCGVICLLISFIGDETRRFRQTHQIDGV
jgi:signal peptidase II